MYNSSFGCLLAYLFIIFAGIAGWITHVVYCIANQEWLLLIAGGLVAPIGSIHGWMIWFGAGLV